MPTHKRPFVRATAMKQLIRLASKLKIKNLSMVNKSRSKGKARPTKSLSVGYKGSPNQYRFIRETRPETIDIGTDGGGVTILSGTGSIPDTSILEFASFSIDQLAGGFSEFSNLFGNYRIDSITTYLIPLWQQQTQQGINPSGAVWTQTAYVPNLVITRVNTKYLPNGYVLPANAETNRDKLAQIQKKTRTMYGTKKWLKVITHNPRVFQKIEDGQGGTNLVARPSPWLPTTEAADQQYAMNDIIFADKLDGTDFSAGIYKYRMFHRVNFRCSFVG